MRHFLVTLILGGIHQEVANDICGACMYEQLLLNQIVIFTDKEPSETVLQVLAVRLLSNCEMFAGTGAVVKNVARVESDHRTFRFEVITNGEEHFGLAHLFVGEVSVWGVQVGGPDDEDPARHQVKARWN